MTDQISKDVTIIVSTGRTGTRFLGKTLGNVIRDCVSFHEPDMVTLKRPGKLKTISQFGVYQTIIGKLLDKTGIRAIGLRYLSGQTGKNQTARQLIRHRAKFYGRQRQSLIIESYNQWFSLLDVLPLVFREYRVAAIIRDPRSWLSSASKWGLWWHSSDLVSKLGLLRLSPDLVGDSEKASEWRNMDSFERMAWSWNQINSILTAHATADNRVKMFRFEDLFGDKQNKHEIGSFLDFVTDFGPHRYSFTMDSLMNSPLIHASDGDSEFEWKAWNESRCRQVDQLCGRLMRRWGYGFESDWLSRIESQLTGNDHPRA